MKNNLTLTLGVPNCGAGRADKIAVTIHHGFAALPGTAVRWWRWTDVWKLTGHRVVPGAVLRATSQMSESAHRPPAVHRPRRA